jgi:two-component sensor histidine kinase
MIPIGLILNEAISNSFKHAFPGKNGTISIHLEKINGLHKLTIADNGTGIHNDRWRTGTTLGIQLIHTLAEQLDAKMEMIHKDGVTYIFEFE